jgi:hypothetical protein
MTNQYTRRLCGRHPPRPAFAELEGSLHLDRCAQRRLCPAHQTNRDFYAGMTVVYWGLAFVIAAAIPQVQTIAGLVAAVCVMQFTYTFPPLLIVGFFVLRDGRDADGHFSWKRVRLSPCFCSFQLAGADKRLESAGPHDGPVVVQAIERAVLACGALYGVPWHVRERYRGEGDVQALQRNELRVQAARMMYPRRVLCIAND